MPNLPLHSPSLQNSSSKFNLPSINYKLIVLCLIWYLTSVVSSSSTKKILMEFKHPVSLTEVQFVMNAFFCILTMWIFQILEKRGMGIIQVFPPGTFPENLTKEGYHIINSFLYPSNLVFKTTVPMGMFQFMGQIASHNATSIIPVSLVHTIKALSPMTTVLIYRFFFGKIFSSKTYMTLIPLIAGVMLSCSRNSSKHNEESVFHKGCIFAFISMLIFVAQNIFAKKILTWDEKQKLEDDEDRRANNFLQRFNWKVTRSESATSTPILPISHSFKSPRSEYFDVQQNLGSSASSSNDTSRNNSTQNLSNFVNDSTMHSKFIFNSPQKKLDKISVLFYCSIVGFFLTFPVFLVSEFNFFKKYETLTIFTMEINTIYWILIYSISHFVQSLMAFQILGMVSPINYSIANILKRIIIIAFSIIIEGTYTQLNSKQWIGLFLTFVGLYSYDRWGVERKS
ncbi:Sly41 protein [Martiniozyma asiatica (nom. inval.)]|nr:Sly41 protein [Martiniozyma asiatica]